MNDEETTTDAVKNAVLIDAIDKAAAEDPTRFSTRSFAVLWNEGHSVRLISRKDPRQALSIPWHEIAALRAILDCDTSKGYSTDDDCATPGPAESGTGLYNEDGSYTPVAQNIWDHSRAKAIAECVKKIPTNFLDPLLTGSDAVIRAPYNNADIERLLNGIRERLESLAKAEGVK
jgi:hypothetical protein